MHEDLPPTASLRAFSSIARTLSFKAAAKELHLSPSALSRQIQSLEEHLGVSLFHRRNPGLELTQAGREYLTTVEAILRDLRRAQEALGARAAGPLRISTLESFSARWLVPRLSKFEAAHPGIELSLEATFRYADFARDPVDVAIRFGTGPWQGLHSEPIVELDCFPVCSPGLREGERPLIVPRDLEGHALIHVSQVPGAWETWLSHAGCSGLIGRRSVSYDHVGIALSAAEAGQGVALSARILCERELAEGRLCMPFDLCVASPQTYHFVCRPEGLDDFRIAALRDWLIGSLG